jgi:hypothetical protein
MCDLCVQGNLLDCSGSSEDVFEPPSRVGSSVLGGRRKPVSKCYNMSVPHQPLACGSIVGVDAASAGISRFVLVVTASEINRDSPCPICLQDMNPGSPMVVALTRCLHQLHLDCLNSMLSSQPSTNKVSRGFVIISVQVCTMFDTLAFNSASLNCADHSVMTG